VKQAEEFIPATSIAGCVGFQGLQHLVSVRRDVRKHIDEALHIGNVLLDVVANRPNKPHLCCARHARVVPVRNLDADKDADNDNNQVEDDGRPVLGPHMFRDASEYQVTGPERASSSFLVEERVAIAPGF
jgi:hypothetical protein